MHKYETPRKGAARIAPRRGTTPKPSSWNLSRGNMISIPEKEYHMLIVLMALAVIVSIACVSAVWLYAIPTAEHALEIARGL